MAAISTGVTATQAAFNDTATSGMTAASGTLSIQSVGTPRVASDGKTVTDMISTQKLYPRAIASNEYTVTNSGNLRMNYTITTVPTTSSIAQRAMVTIKSGTTVLYTGKLSSISTTARVLDAGKSETLTVETSVPVESYVAASNLDGLVDQSTRIQVSGKVAT